MNLLFTMISVNLGESVASSAVGKAGAWRDSSDATLHPFEPTGTHPSGGNDVSAPSSSH